VKCHDVDVANFSKETRSPPSYSHELHGIRLHHHLLQIRHCHGSHSYANTPILLIAHRLSIHQYRSMFPAIQFWLSRVEWLFVERWPASQSLPPHIVESCQKSGVSLSPECLDHERLLIDFCDHLVLSFPLLKDYPYALQQHRLRRTLLRLAVLLWAFFYHSFSKCRGHLLDVTTVQVKFLCYLRIGQVQPHKIETQDPNLERLMMARKDSAGKIIKALPAIFTFITLLGSFFVIKAPSYNRFGITKCTSPTFRPALFTHCVITLCIIYQILYVYPHLLNSFRILKKTKIPYITSRPRNPT